RLVSRRRTRGLNPAQQSLVGEGGQGVVDRLPGDGADLAPDGLVDVVRRAVRPFRDGFQHRDALGRDLNAVAAQKRRRIKGGLHRSDSLDHIKSWTVSRKWLAGNQR